jgi:hypothetical protein
VSASIRHPANAGVIAYRDRHPDRPPVADLRPPRPDARDYWECGSHPDVVERVWDQLGRLLPAESRMVVLGTPALIHPENGLVLALAIGTQYALRLPSPAWRNGLPPSVQTTTRWAGGVTMDIQQTLGPDWVFGTWGADEESWCLERYREEI